MKEISAHGFDALSGAETGVSDWITIEQPMIDAFARLTGDYQYIHVDSDRARKGPFGTTIAHGMLTLSLLSAMAMAALPRVKGTISTINYGFDRVRLIAPVLSGARIRGRFTLKQQEPRGAGEVLMTWNVTVEIEGQDRPALIADWLALRQFAPTDDG